MTTIKITRTQTEIKSILIADHSMFGKSGQDIVCASISTLAFYTVNALKAFDKDRYVESKVDEANVTIAFNVKHREEISQTLLELLIQHLFELEKQYKKNITIEEK